MQEALNLTSNLTSIPNKGSCFSVTIPLAEGIVVATEKILSKENYISTPQLTVWCIDDDINNLDAMRTLIQKWQCQVHCVSSYDECLNLTEQPDLLLVDYQLGNKENGLTLIETLRNQIW